MTWSAWNLICFGGGIGVAFMQAVGLYGMFWGPCYLGWASAIGFVFLLGLVLLQETTRRHGRKRFDLAETQLVRLAVVRVSVVVGIMAFVLVAVSGAGMLAWSRYQPRGQVFQETPSHYDAAFERPVLAQRLAYVGHRPGFYEVSRETFIAQRGGFLMLWCGAVGAMSCAISLRALAEPSEPMSTYSRRSIYPTA